MPFTPSRLSLLPPPPFPGYSPPAAKAKDKKTNTATPPPPIVPPVPASPTQTQPGTDASKRRARALLAFKDNLRAQDGPTTVDTRRGLGRMELVGKTGKTPEQWDRDATMAFDALHPQMQTAWAAFAHGEGPHPDTIASSDGSSGGMGMPFGKLGAPHAKLGPVRPAQTLQAPVGDMSLLAQARQDASAGITSRGTDGSVAYENGATITPTAAAGKTLASPYGSGSVTFRDPSTPATPGRINMSNTYDKEFFNTPQPGTTLPAPTTGALAQTKGAGAADGRNLPRISVGDVSKLMPTGAGTTGGLSMPPSPISTTSGPSTRVDFSNTNPLPAPTTPNPVRTTPLPPIQPATQASTDTGSTLKRPVLAGA